jgi:hypothetical protein
VLALARGRSDRLVTIRAALLLRVHDRSYFLTLFAARNSAARHAATFELFWHEGAPTCCPGHARDAER